MTSNKSNIEIINIEIKKKRNTKRNLFSLIMNNHGKKAIGKAPAIT